MSKKTPDNKPAVDNKISFVSNMKKSYVGDVVPNMISRFSYDNAMEVPKLLSISLNIGIGDAKTSSKSLESAMA